MIWIYAVHRDDAGAKAVEIVEQLPYEKFKVGYAWEETWRVTVHSTDYESPLPEFRECKQRALQVGLAIFFHACETGADEADFEKQNCF